MSVKNRLIYSLINLAQRFIKKNPPLEERRFLIVSTTGLGDSIWATPAIKALRQRFPTAHISFLTSPLGEQTLKNNPHINEIFVIRSSIFFSFLHLFFPLKKLKIDTIFLFHTSQRLVLPFCSLLGASILIGTKEINKGLDALLTQALDKRPYHEIARRLEIVSQTGAYNPTPFLELYPSLEDEHIASESLKSKNIPSFIPLIGIHPGAKDKFKQWPPEAFIETGKLLKDHLGCQIILTGNSNEKELAEKIASEIPGAFSLAGKLSVLQTAAVMKKLSVIVSNDTGPMHIAFAMRTPTVSIFVPTDANLCGPYFFQDAVILQKLITCTPCLRKKCHDPFCMLQIGPKEVFEAALKLFYHQKIEI